MVTDVGCAGGATDRDVYRLMTWLSPAFPVGGYSYSHGLETAIDQGQVRDADGLCTWIEGIVAFGSLHVDAVLLRLASEAAAAGDEAAFAMTATRAATLRGTSELALESAAQGQAFLDTVRTAWPDLDLAKWVAALADADRPPAYCVAVGLVAAVAAIPLRPAVTAFLHAGVATLVSAGVRHIPLGQTQGQRTMANLEDPIKEATDAAMATGAEDLGAAALTVDWCSARHETQTVRLFRS